MTLTPPARRALTSASTLVPADPGKLIALDFLAALASISDSYAARALESAEIDLAAVQAAARAVRDRGAGTPSVTTRESVVRSAERIASAAQHELVGTEHIFFALTDDPDVRRFLDSREFPLDRERAAVLGRS